MQRILSLLNVLDRSDQSFNEMKIKGDLAPDHLADLLKWCEEQGLLWKDPFSERYGISDTGRIVLHLPSSLEKLLQDNPLELHGSLPGAPSILLDPEPLRRVRESMDESIIGEHTNKLLLFLIFLSKDLGPENAQACFIMGSSSSGKSYLMHNVLSYFPQEQVIWLTRSSAHGLEYYLKGKDLTGYILAVEEAPGLQDAQASIRPMFSEKGLRIITAQALGGGKVVSRVMEIKGCPAFVTTLAYAAIDDEMATRAWIISTDESGQTHLICKVQLNRRQTIGQKGAARG